MTAPRKDVKVYLDEEVHAALKAICNARDCGLGEFIERLVVREVQQQVHDVMLLADEFRRAGIVRNHQESPGKTGHHPGDR